MRLVSTRPEERVYRRHAGDVYRFALALLQDPSEAEGVTRAVVARAAREDEGGRRVSDVRTWMIDAAHASCRARSEPEAPLGAPHLTATCAEAATVSREADGVLPRRETRRLRAHLGRCVDCDGWGRSLRAQRRAFRALAVEPAPGSLLP